MEFFILLFETVAFFILRPLDKTVALETSMPPLNWRKPKELRKNNKKRNTLLDEDSILLLEFERNEALINFFRLIQDKMIPI